MSSSQNPFEPSTYHSPTTLLRLQAENFYLTDVDKCEGERNEVVSKIVCDQSLDDIDAAALIMAICILEERVRIDLMSRYYTMVKDRTKYYVTHPDEVNDILGRYGAQPITVIPQNMPRRSFRTALPSRIENYYLTELGFPDDVSKEFEVYYQKTRPFLILAASPCLSDEEATSLMASLWVLEGGVRLEELMKWPFIERVKERIRFYVDHPDVARENLATHEQQLKPKDQGKFIAPHERIDEFRRQLPLEMRKYTLEDGTPFFTEEEISKEVSSLTDEMIAYYINTRETAAGYADTLYWVK